MLLLFSRINTLIQKYKLKKSENKIRHRTKSTTEQIPLKNVSVQNEIYDMSDDIKVKPELIRCYSDYILTDPGPRPLFGEYIEMCKLFNSMFKGKYTHICVMNTTMRKKN